MDVTHHIGQEQDRKRTTSSVNHVWCVLGFAVRLFIEFEWVNGNERVNKCITSQ